MNNFIFKSSCTKCWCRTCSIKTILSQEAEKRDWDKRCRYCFPCCKATRNQTSLYTLKRYSDCASITLNWAKSDSVEGRPKWHCGELFLCDYVRRTRTLNLSSPIVRQLATKYGKTKGNHSRAAKMWIRKLWKQFFLNDTYSAALKTRQQCRLNINFWD